MKVYVLLCQYKSTTPTVYGVYSSSALAKTRVAAEDPETQWSTRETNTKGEWGDTWTGFCGTQTRWSITKRTLDL